jgi:hypothetical protein
MRVLDGLVRPVPGIQGKAKQARGETPQRDIYGDPKGNPTQRGHVQLNELTVRLFQ